ncbi:NB-ARC domain-containing protein [Kitasatospora hibisci]|uniref:NB-ARC domain-containing protein n=1 Tax=Kitasatospora hibisci TaxID=3369522 RepID=UPI003754B6B7
MPDPTRNRMTGGTVNGQLIQANHVNLTFEAAQGPPGPRWPHQVGVVPTVADAFQTRGLVAAIAEAGAVVLVGMGGIGKTQLAAHHAHAELHDGHVDLLVWVTAVDRQAVRQTYAQASVELGLAPTGDPDRFLAWLNTTDCRWLVVLDDLQDPADLRGLWPPGTATGHLVATTRRRDPALRTAGRAVLDVELFSPEESLAYLTERLDLHGLAEPDDELAALAEDLGRLPLALAQAAAYLIDLADTGHTAADYRAGLRARRPLAELAPGPAALPDDQSATLAAVLALSLERADAATAGLATPMLQLASVLDPNGIPVAVLVAEKARTHLGPDVSGAAAEEVLRSLSRLCLADRIMPTPEHRPDLFRVHVLTQHAAHDTVPNEDARAALLERATGALVDAWTEAFDRQEISRVMAANSAVLRHRDTEAWWNDTGKALARIEGVVLGTSGCGGDAAEHFGRLAAAACARLGPDDGYSCEIRGLHAYHLGLAGDPDGAAALLEDLLADQLRLLGPEHTDVLTTRRDLCRFLGDQPGELEAARCLAAELTRQHGSADQRAWAARMEVAGYLMRHGDFAAAAAEMAETGAPEVSEGLDPRELDVLSSAVQLLVQLLSDRSDAAAQHALIALSEEHGRCAGTSGDLHLLVRTLLGMGLLFSGRTDVGREEVEQVLPDLLRMLGADHAASKAAQEILDVLGPGPSRVIELGDADDAAL